MSPAAKKPADQPDEKVEKVTAPLIVLELAKALQAADIGDAGREALDGFMKKYG